MRILTIGRSKSAEILTNYLCKEDKNYLIFTTAKNTEANFIDIDPQNVIELKDFALANEITLTIVCDYNLFYIDYFTEFSENGLAIFTPDIDAARICLSKTYGKKFIYKNKILTPKFAFFEKAVPAIEYARNSNYPIVIKPDIHTDTQAPYIAETFASAKNCIERLFQTDNKKIVIEEYIFGKEVTAYAISDGFNPIVIDFETSYGLEFAIKGAFLDEKIKEKIYSKIILPTISILAQEETEYVGIIGFDLIITPDERIYLLEYNPFFKDLDIEFMLDGTDEVWTKLFCDAITGTLAEKIENPFRIKKTNDYKGAFILDNQIINQSANTLNMLKTKLLEEGLSKQTLQEAEKIWKN